MDITVFGSDGVIVAWKADNSSILYFHFQVLQACLGLKGIKIF